MKSISAAILCSLFFCFATAGQKGNSLPCDKAKVRNSDGITCYGVDFSHVRITDAEKVSKNPVYRTAYPPAWITFIEKELPAPDYFRKSINKASFVYGQKEIYDRSINVAQNLIISQDYSFPADTVRAIIASYKLEQTKGVGLVFIAENFNKPKEEATTWVAFFDIGTREVLWASKVKGGCAHMGYTAHWASGTIEGIKFFFKKEYNR